MTKKLCLSCKHEKSIHYFDLKGCGYPMMNKNNSLFETTCNCGGWKE